MVNGEEFKMRFPNLIRFLQEYFSVPVNEFPKLSVGKEIMVVVMV
jgi:hypothetical protein